MDGMAEPIESNPPENILNPTTRKRRLSSLQKTLQNLETESTGNLTNQANQPNQPNPSETENLPIKKPAFDPTYTKFRNKYKDKTLTEIIEDQVIPSIAAISEIRDSYFHPRRLDAATFLFNQGVPNKLDRISRAESMALDKLLDAYVELKQIKSNNIKQIVDIEPINS